MPKFIRLTTINNTVYLNVDAIRDISYVGINNVRSKIAFMDDNSLFVEQTPEAILAMIEDQPE